VSFKLLQYDQINQVNETVRLDASKTFSPKGSAAITKIEVKPEATASFIDISGATPLQTRNWYLDWIYQTDGLKTITLKVTQVGAIESEQEFQVNIVTAVDDNLYSSDQDLISLEHDILNYLPQGRSSYNYVHRKAQKEILEWLDQIRIYRKDGSRLQKEDLNLVQDIRELSANWALMLIFNDLSNKTDDKFYQKYTGYRTKVEAMKNRGRIQADLDGSGEIEESEKVDLRTFRLLRR
jgi:hypothetical protein